MGVQIDLRTEKTLDPMTGEAESDVLNLECLDSTGEGYSYSTLVILFVTLFVILFMILFKTELNCAPGTQFNKL